MELVHAQGHPQDTVKALALTLLLLFCVPVALVETGCTTSQKAVAYKTLNVTALTVDAALKAYADALVKEKVDQATQIKVYYAKARYEMAFKLAIEAARGDVTKLTPDDVQRIADELLTLIIAVTGKAP